MKRLFVLQVLNNAAVCAFYTGRQQEVSEVYTLHNVRSHDALSAIGNAAAATSYKVAYLRSYIS